MRILAAVTFLISALAVCAQSTMSAGRGLVPNNYQFASLPPIDVTLASVVDSPVESGLSSLGLNQNSPGMPGIEDANQNFYSLPAIANWEQSAALLLNLEESMTGSSPIQGTPTEIGVVPEPSSVALFGLAILVIVSFRRMHG